MTPSQVNDSNGFTIQACGGMQRKGGEGERTHRDWCCEEGREVGNGREIPTSVKRIVIKVSIDSQIM